MRDFLLGLLIPATIFLGYELDHLKSRADALQLQINLVTNDVTRENSCKNPVAVLSQGVDFYHPKEIMVCQR